MFKNWKDNCLSKLDKSKKGSVDKDIVELVESINSKDEYFTTSSCSGRIVLIRKEDFKKKESEWLLCSHDDVTFEDVRHALENAEGDIFLRQESMILHVCCASLDAANKLIEAAKHVGFKRSGINAISNKIIVEILSTEYLEAPVLIDGKIIVSDDYLKILIKESNKRMSRTREKIKKLSSIFSSGI